MDFRIKGYKSGEFMSELTDIVSNRFNMGMISIEHEGDYAIITVPDQTIALLDEIEILRLKNVG